MKQYIIKSKLGNWWYYVCTINPVDGRATYISHKDQAKRWTDKETAKQMAEGIGRVVEDK